MGYNGWQFSWMRPCNIALVALLLLVSKFGMAQTGSAFAPDCIKKFEAMVPDGPKVLRRVPDGKDNLWRAIKKGRQDSVYISNFIIYSETDRQYFERQIAAIKQEIDDAEKKLNTLIMALRGFLVDPESTILDSLGRAQLVQAKFLSNRIEKLEKMLPYPMRMQRRYLEARETAECALIEHCAILQQCRQRYSEK